MHHNNILLRPNGNPLIIDFDDAVVDKYTSIHSSYMAYCIHDIKSKGNLYKEEIIKNGNLDRENLFIILLDFLLNEKIEKKNIYEYYQMLDMLRTYFPDDFVNAISKLKTEGLEVIPYEYYIGDFLKGEEIKEGCVKVKEKKLWNV